MNELFEYFRLLLDSKEIIAVGGLTLITMIVYAETGFFFCFFLPGDYLLFLAGLSCAVDIIDVHISLLVGCILGAAICGNYTAYLFGRLVGARLFQKKDSLFFKQKYLNSARQFFTKYGGKALILARFLPIIRTFAPILAGTADMKFGSFSLYNISGGMIWVFTMVLSGYFLGVQFPQIINYVEYIILGFISLTTVMLIKSYFKIRNDQRKSSSV